MVISAIEDLNLGISSVDELVSKYQKLYYLRGQLDSATKRNGSNGKIGKAVGRPPLAIAPSIVSEHLDTTEYIAAQIRSGVSLKTACSLAGIGEAAATKWKRRGEEIANNIESGELDIASIDPSHTDYAYLRFFLAYREARGCYLAELEKKLVQTALQGDISDRYKTCIAKDENGRILDHKLILSDRTCTKKFNNVFALLCAVSDEYKNKCDNEVSVNVNTIAASSVSKLDKMPQKEKELLLESLDSILE